MKGQTKASTRPTLSTEGCCAAVAQHKSVTVVVPCYNEEAGLPYLAEKLADLKNTLGVGVTVSFILVDDGSTDDTWAVMHALFGQDASVTCLRHKSNQGISAATATGIAASSDEAVAVIDSDCSYDPRLIADMLPRLIPGVSVVTASPYHPSGTVEGIPGWRLFVSRGASWAYRQLLRNRLATYTSCFRLYRKSAVVSLPRRRDGFSGVVEILALLDRQGWRVDEVPAQLKTRKFGQSKMRLLRVTGEHLALMSWIAFGKRTSHTIPARNVPAGVHIDGEHET